jgi:membrane-bound ClpP family serine protease
MLAFWIVPLLLFVPTLHGQEPSPQLLEQLKQHINYADAGSNRVGYILIEDHATSITQATWLYVKKALEHYKEMRPAFVILELNTPGGEVFAAQKISDALKEFDTQYGIPVVCVINNWAISAGAMLAYSCRFIITAKDGSMGAAEPVIMGEDNKMVSASEKINSALRADLANRASFFGRNPNIAEAMVDKDIILVWRDGHVVKLDAESQIHSDEPNRDIVINNKGKLLTLSAQQMIAYGVADMMLEPTRVTGISPEEDAAGHWPTSKMALFHAPFFKELPAGEVEAFRPDWKMQFFALLASPFVSSLLLLGAMLGIYVELTTPGFGVPGTIGVVCLLLIFISSFALEIANWLEVVLFLAGLAIMAIDLLFLPTFGLLGIVGALFFLAGLVGMLVPGIEGIQYGVDSDQFKAVSQAVIYRLNWLMGTLLLGGVLIAFVARYLTPTLASYSKLVLLGNEQDASAGYVASQFDKSAIGKEAIVLSDLKPGGYILIDGQKLQAISNEGYIPQGCHVEVIGGQEESLMVKLKKQG